MNMEELKRLAEAATPGPWWEESKVRSLVNEHCYQAIGAREWVALAEVLVKVEGEPCAQGKANAAFIAAANPATVLELIAERDELVEALERIKVSFEFGKVVGIDPERCENGERFVAAAIAKARAAS